MSLSAERRARLAHEANVFGERAALAYLDGYVEPAVEAADQAVKAAELLHRDDPDDHEVTEFLGDGYTTARKSSSLWR